MIEYVVGPILALLIGMKFTDFKSKEEHKLMEAQIEQLTTKLTEVEQELPKKVIATVMPVAKAVQKLNQEVGL